MAISKKILLILALLLVGCAGRQSASSRLLASNHNQFHCSGVYDDNLGAEMTLAIYEDSFTADGSVNEGDGFSPQVFCNGGLIAGKLSARFLHFSTNHECSADALTVMKSLLAEGGGLVALVKKVNGQQSHRGQFAYRYYRCER